MCGKRELIAPRPLLMMVYVSRPQRGLRPVQRRVKQAEVPECPTARSSIRDRTSSSVRYSTIGARSATRVFQGVGIPVADTDGSFLDSPFMPAACGHPMNCPDRRLLTADPVFLRKKREKTLILFAQTHGALRSGSKRPVRMTPNDWLK